MPVTGQLRVNAFSDLLVQGWQAARLRMPSAVKPVPATLARISSPKSLAVRLIGLPVSSCIPFALQLQRLCLATLQLPSSEDLQGSCMPLPLRQ
jgi:hypothetical protein